MMMMARTMVMHIVVRASIALLERRIERAETIGGGIRGETRFAQVQGRGGRGTLQGQGL
jgi:hypothetical protein